MNTTDTRHDLSIYIHIPFCERKCLYCDFLSFSAQSGQIDEYVRALSKEIELYGAEFSGFTVRSIFFGGGTPSFPDEKLICGLLEKIFDCFVVDDRCENSIEVNPASAMKEKLIAYKKAGFNRLSIGAQSMSDTELKRLGRLHSSRQFLETFENARSAGFNNINVDLMSAIPEQDIDSYRETLMKVITLKPEHISAYSLIVEEGTPFCDMELDLPSEEVDRKMYHETKKLLSEHGYFRYEISNYARRDGGAAHSFECYHNKVYWQRGNYLGLGLGAASMVNNVRWSNIRDMKTYIEALSRESKTGISKIRTDVQKLSVSEQMEEFMFLGLRLVRGVSTEEFKRLFGRSIFDVYGNVISKYQKMGLLELYGENVFLRLTDLGLDVSNTVMAEFLLG